VPGILTVTLNPALDVSASTAEVIPTRKLRCHAVQRHPGGGGINVARVVHRLGSDCTAIFPCGGPTGALLQELLLAEGVHIHPMDATGHTRESFTVLEMASGREFRFVLPGPELAPAVWQDLLLQLPSLAASASFLVGSGSLPPGVPGDFYARMAVQARQMGVPMAVDSSGDALRQAIQAGVDVVKPSVGELRELTGKPIDTMQEARAAALEWIARGKVEIATVSLGAQGALLVTRSGAWWAQPLAVKVVSAVGAGDSFLAGLVSGLCQHKTPLDAFALAVACGSAAVMCAGTGLIAASDADTLLKQVTIVDCPDHMSIVV